MQDIIRSPSGAKYRRWHSLLQKKYRDREGLYLIEGRNVIGDAQKAGLSFQALLIRTSGSKPDVTSEDMVFAEEVARKTAIQPTFLTRELFDRLNPTETGRGILAVVRKTPWSLDDFRRKPDRRDLLILDRIQDPGNLGTMLRTAEAASFAGIIAIRGTADFFQPKLVRAAAGSLFRLPLLLARDGKEAVELARRLELRVIGSGLDTDLTYTACDFTSPTALIIGNEGQGVSEDLLDLCDAVCKIPMATGVNSLNAAVAAALLIYECRRQKGEAAGQVGCPANADLSSTNTDINKEV